MNPYQVVRIVCLLAVIFVAGLITGRLTAPAPRVIAMNAAGRPLSAELMLASFKAEIPMNAEEELKLRRYLETIEGEMASYPVLSQPRLEIFRRTVVKMKEILSADKHAAVDRLAADMERKFETHRRRRGLPATPQPQKNP
jgi:hypothetical protein